MPNEKIGRLLVASLHQAIAEMLPARLEFYETWLDTRKLRRESVGLGQLVAALSFLRQEDAEYDQVVTLAATYAVDWTVESWPPLMTNALGALPTFARRRVVLRLASRLLRRLGSVRRLTFRSRRVAVDAEVIDSVFCDVRAKTVTALCTFHAAAIARLLERFGLVASVEIARCRAVEGESCLLSVTPGSP